MSISKLQGLHMIFVSSENREFGTAGARRAAARQARWWARWASGATATAATAGLLREMTMYFMYSLTLCNIHLPSRYVYVYVCNLYSHNFSEKYIYIIYPIYTVMTSHSDVTGMIVRVGNHPQVALFHPCSGASFVFIIQPDIYLYIQLCIAYVMKFVLVHVIVETVEQFQKT